MARSYLLVPVALLLAGAASLSSSEVDNRRLPPVGVTVSGCAGNNVSVSINPWDVIVRPGETVDWTVAGADSMDIVPLNRGGRPWPFQQNPGRARPGSPANSGARRPNVATGGYPYQIVLYCNTTNPDGTTRVRRIVIDPEVIIEDN